MCVGWCVFANTARVHCTSHLTRRFKTAPARLDHVLHGTAPDGSRGQAVAVLSITFWEYVELKFHMCQANATRAMSAN